MYRKQFFSFTSISLVYFGHFIGIDILVLLGFSPWFAVVFYYLCCVLLLCSFVGFSFFTAVALLGFFSVLMGCLGAFCDYVLIPSALCWVLLRYWVLTAPLLGSVLFLYGVLSVFFMHDSIASLAGFFQFSCGFVLSFGSLKFSWVLLHAQNLQQTSQLYHWFSPANHSTFPEFSCHTTATSIDSHCENIFSVLSANWAGGQHWKNRKIHNLIRVSSTAVLTDFC